MYRSKVSAKEIPIAATRENATNDGLISDPALEVLLRSSLRLITTSRGPVRAEHGYALLSRFRTVS
jgi:hypothetical protein